MKKPFLFPSQLEGQGSPATMSNLEICPNWNVRAFLKFNDPLVNNFFHLAIFFIPFIREGSKDETLHLLLAHVSTDMSDSVK